MYFSMTLENGKEIQDKLNQLSKGVSGKIVRANLRTAQKLLLASAKNYALSKVGGNMGKAIAKAMTLRTSKRKMRGSYSLSVFLKDNPDFVHITKSGKRMAKGRMVRGSYYIPAAIEYGHRIAGSSRSVRSISFMLASDAQTRQARINMFQNGVKREIEKVFAVKGK